jgi:hypothetical protein
MTLKVDGTNGVLQAYDYQVLTTGFTYTFAAGTTTLIANPAGTLATGTITMPAAPADGMVIIVTTTQEITALTLSGNTGQSIGGTQTTLLPANSAVQFVYRLSNTTWYRLTSAALGNIGTAPVYAARAWVNFNGTGTVAIRASGNVSSITDNGTGDYTVNFTTAMTDANYAQNVSASFTGGAYAETTIGLNFTSSFTTQAPTASAFRFCLGYARGNQFIDQAYVVASVFR